MHGRSLASEADAVVLGKAVPQQHLADLLVVLEGTRVVHARVGKDLVEQIEPVAANVVLEKPAVALQPRPGDRAVAVLPDPDRPLVLTPLVLEEPPGDVADMPWRAHAEVAPLLEGELVHRCDDLGRESHV